MLGLGLWEIAAIFVVALIVIKPKDLPQVVRTIAKLRGKALELYSGVTATLEDAEKQISREIRETRNVVVGQSESDVTHRSASAELADDPYTVDQAAETRPEDAEQHE